MFSNYIKIPSLQNVYVYYITAGLPFLLLLVALNTNIISAKFFVIGMLIWVIFYHPLITGMRRNLLNYQKLIDARVEMQELTYEHIARELHDNINFYLNISRLHLTDLNDHSEKEREEKVNTAVRLITRSIVDLTTISRSLNMDRFRESSFHEVLNDEINNLNLRSSFSVTLKVKNEPVSLGIEREMQIFRIIQESLSNILRHAKASNVTVLLHYHDTYLETTVTDDGQGFEYIEDDPTRITAGLRNMKGRAKAMKGKFMINSAPGQGTSVSVWVRYTELKNSLFYSFWDRIMG